MIYFFYKKGSDYSEYCAIFIIKRSRGEKKKKSFNKKSDSHKEENTSSTYIMHYDIYSHILFLCKEDEMLANFFEKLAEMKKNLEQEDEEIYMKQFDESAVEYLKIEKKFLNY